YGTTPTNSGTRVMFRAIPSRQTSGSNPGRLQRIAGPSESDTPGSSHFTGRLHPGRVCAAGWWLAVDRDVLSALFPLRTAKQVRADFDQPRKHFEYRDRSPPCPLPSAVSATINLFGNARIGTLLYQELHQLHQNFALLRILFQALGFWLNPQSERHLGGQLLLCDFYLPFPLDGHQFPAFLGLLFQIRVGRWGGNQLTHSLCLLHVSTLSKEISSTCSNRRSGSG